MAITKPFPLYPTYVELCIFSMDEYPQLNEQLINNENWWSVHWHWGKSFLDYIGRNKSSHTYERFRNEIERFLLWAFLEKKKPIDELRERLRPKN